MKIIWYLLKCIFRYGKNDILKALETKPISKVIKIDWDFFYINGRYN